MEEKLSAKAKQELLESQLFSTDPPVPSSYGGNPCNTGENHGSSVFGYEHKPKLFGLEKFDALVEGAPEQEKQEFLSLLKKMIYTEDCYKKMFEDPNHYKTFKSITGFAESCINLYDSLNYEPCLKSTPEHLNRGGKKVQAQYVQHQAEVYLKRYVQILKNVRKMKYEWEEREKEKIEKELEATEKRLMEKYFWYTFALNELKRRLPFEKDVLEMHSKYLDEVIQISSVQRALKTSKDPEILEALRCLPHLSKIVNQVQIPQERKAKLVLKKPAPVPKTEPPFQTLTKYTEHEFYCTQLTAKPELEREYGATRATMKRMVIDILMDMGKTTVEKEGVKDGIDKSNPSWYAMSPILHLFVLYEAAINGNKVIAGCEEKLEQVLEYRKTQMDILNAEYSWLQQIVTEKKITEFPPIFVPEKKPSCYELLRCEMLERKQIHCMVSIIQLHFNSTIVAELAVTNKEFLSALETSVSMDDPLTHPSPPDFAGIDQMKELRRQLRAVNLGDKTVKK